MVWINPVTLRIGCAAAGERAAQMPSGTPTRMLNSRDTKTRNRCWRVSGQKSGAEQCCPEARRLFCLDGSLRLRGSTCQIRGGDGRRRLVGDLDLGVQGDHLRGADFPPKRLKLGPGLRQARR